MYRSDASPGGPGLHPGKLSKMFSFAKLYHISKSLVEKCHIKEFHDDTLCKRKCNLVFYIQVNKDFHIFCQAYTEQRTQKDITNLQTWYSIMLNIARSN